MDDDQHLRDKARMLLQREREHFELLQKYERLGVWTSLGQALPEFFLDRKVTQQQRWDRLRKTLISRLRLQRVLIVEVAGGELRPLSPAGPPLPLPPEARALLDARPFGFCNDAEAEEQRDDKALANALGLHRFMWSRIAQGASSELLLAAGFDRVKAAFQSPFAENDAAWFRNATQHVESLLANALLVAELESEKAQLLEANTTLEKRDGELRQAAADLLAANESLELRVRERTHELADKNAQLRLVLDNVDQALVTVDLDGRLASERSSAVDRWFGAYTGEPHFLEHVPADARFASLFRLGFSALRDDVLPREVCLDQMPKHLIVNARHFECRYLPIELGATLKALLLVIDDVTEQRARARADAEQRELLAAFTALMQDRNGFLSFVEQTTLQLAQLVDATCPALRQSQLLHTLKGNAATFGLQVIADQCHQAESELSERGDVHRETYAGLRARWAAVTDTVSTVAPSGLRRAIEVSEEQLAGLLARAVQGVSALELVEELRQLQREPVLRGLERLAQHAQGLAKRLGRPPLLVEVSADDLRLDPEKWMDLWSTLVHVVRNAIDHGIELPEDRGARGKPVSGQLRFLARRVGNGYRLEIIDDGRGVDWEGVRRICQQRQLASSSHADLVAALLSPGFSTRREVTQTSGRGVGLSAVDAAVRQLGGVLQIESEPGQGTRLAVSFPDISFG